MGRRKNKPLLNVEITGVADKGKGIGRYNDLVVFVEGGVPGDIVNVRVRKKKKNYYEGLIGEMVKPSPDRIDAFCKHFGSCGGCKWQNLAYEVQLKHKEKVVFDAIQRIAKLDPSRLLPILPALGTTYYRNKLEYTFSNKRWLTEEEINSKEEFPNRKAVGFHRPGGYNRIVDIEHCYLQGDPSNDIRDAVRDFGKEHDFDFYNVDSHEGYLRNIVIRTTTLDEVMVILSLKYKDEEKQTQLLEYLKEKFPQITSLYYVINTKVNDFILDLDIELYHGKPFIQEQLNHVTFRIGPKSFFQTNTSQAIRLYEKVVEFAEFEGHENVYDLYTGIGSIACYVADKCKHVVGIEEVAMAIEDAKLNAELNKIENTTFYAGDVKDILDPEFAAKHGKPDIIITDPPRAGMHPKVLDTLLQIAAPKIVYVSCNPATQARDIAHFGERYELIKVQPVDMFPHTHHIESIALLKLKEETL